MDAKLTLKLDLDSILKAKSYVSAAGISLSKLVVTFLESISAAQDHQYMEYSLFVKELDGIISLPDDFDHKAIYWRYLVKKYE